MAALLGLMAHQVMADKITPDAARTIAGQFICKNGNGLYRSPGQVKLTLASATAGHYTFNVGQNAGFVMVAADDNVKSTVIGYADEGTFDEATMPDGLRWWLGEWDREVARAAHNPYQETTATVNVAEWADIEPMLTCKWNQDAPYNNLCPYVSGSTTERSATGCSNTALAQVMYYYKWPAHGYGTTEQGNINLTSHQYDWDSMTDTYSDASSKKSEDAVAQLMYDLGMAASTSYGTESGTSSAGMLWASVFNFSYEAQYCPRKFYTPLEWYKLLYGELEAQRPITYIAMSEDGDGGGHAFVFDGYQQGYVHINWGWGGIANGYYLPIALNPKEVGIGGGLGRYNGYQAAILLQKADAPVNQFPITIGACNFNPSTMETTNSATVSFGLNMESMFITSNYSGGIFFKKGSYAGLKVTDAAGNVTYIKANNGISWSYGVDGYTSKNATFNMSNFPKTEGVYTVTPAFHDEITDEWKDMHLAPTAGLRALKATVSGSNITFEKIQGNLGELSASIEGMPAKIETGCDYKLNVNLTGISGEYYGKLTCKAVKKDDQKATEQNLDVNVFVAAGSKQEHTFTWTAPTEAGIYDLLLVDELGRTVGQLNDLQVDWAVPVVSVNRKLVVNNSGSVDAGNMEIEAEIKCSKAPYTNKVIAYFTDDAKKNIYGSIEYTDGVAVGTNMYTIKGSFPEAVVGKKYIVKLYMYDEKGKLTPISASGSGYMNNNSAYFTVTTAYSGIDGVETGSAVKNIEVYSMAGNLLLKQKAVQADLSSLPKGLYIIKADGKSQKVEKQ